MLTLNNQSGSAKKETKDLAHIKSFIKKQVIKFYQNNLVHEMNSMQR